MALQIFVLTIGFLTLPGGVTITKGERGTEEQWINLLGADAYNHHKDLRHLEPVESESTLSVVATLEERQVKPKTKRELVAELIALGDDRSEGALMKFNNEHLHEFIALATPRADEPENPATPDQTIDDKLASEPAT